MSTQRTRLSFSAADLNSELDEARHLLVAHAPHVPPEFLNALFAALEPCAFVLENSSTRGAGELIYRIQLPERFRELLAALRTGDGEAMRAVVAKGLYHKMSFQDAAVA